MGYQPADVACPLLVRASVSGARRQQSPSGSGSSAPEPAHELYCALSVQFAGAGIFREVRLDGCDPVVHLPLLQGWSALTDLGVFRPRRNSLALFGQSGAVRRRCSLSLL